MESFLTDQKTLDKIKRIVETQDLSIKDYDTLYENMLGYKYNRFWNPQPGKQWEAGQSLADEMFYGGSAGSGKVLMDDQVVLTPFGWKKGSDLKLGQIICNPDGSYQKIIQIKPRRTYPEWWVYFSDGTKTNVTKDHLWLAWKANKSRKIKNKKTGGSSSAEIVETKTLKEWIKKGHKPQIPVNQEIPFNRTSREHNKLDSYLLGVLLGDGYLKNVRISCHKRDYFDHYKPILLSLFPRKDFYYRDGTIHFRGETKLYIKTKLMLYNLYFTLSHTKFIPEIYKWGSIEKRYEILQGLMDTDGYSKPTANACYYYSTSKRMAKDVCFIVRSLGGTASMKKKRGKYKKPNGKIVNCKWCYVCYIKHPNPNKLFKMKRKQHGIFGRNLVQKRITKIKVKGKNTGRCITVSNPNGLYITNDFIVTHNSDLILGLSTTKHKKSLILRREGTDLGAMVSRLNEILNNTGSWRGIGPYAGIMRTKDGRVIELKSCPNEKDKYKFQGQDHDLKAFDEITYFSRTQYEFIIKWNRSPDPNQRKRVICAGNPPTSAEGEWVLEAWKPWLDETYDNPAESGELRWYTTIDDEIQWFETGEPIIHKGEKIVPRSRTFIKALLKDNPILEKTGYESVLMSFDEPLRSMFLYGIMKAGLQDHPFQCIPTDWVKAAQQRWKELNKNGKYVPDEPMTILSSDIARGGMDNTVIARRWGNYFGELIKHKGTVTTDGEITAGLIQKEMDDHCKVSIDITGGYGGSPYDILKSIYGNKRIIPVNFAGASKGRDRSGKLKFKNLRAEMHWRLREALDPVHGHNIALPPDRMLLGDLTAVRYKVTAQGIQMEPKEDIIERIGRSPDCGDAVVMCNYGSTLDKFWII